MESKWSQHIASDPQVLAGKPVLRGTRLAVDFILSPFASRWTQEQVLQPDLALRPEALRAVFAYAADVLHEEVVLPVRPPAA